MYKIVITNKELAKKMTLVLIKTNNCFAEIKNGETSFPVAWLENEEKSMKLGPVRIEADRFNIFITVGGAALTIMNDLNNEIHFKSGDYEINVIPVKGGDEDEE